MSWYPCPNCCGPSPIKCVIAQDFFSEASPSLHWTIVSGDWQSESGHFVSAGTGTKAIWDEPAPVVELYLTVWFVSDTENQKFRIYFGVDWATKLGPYVEATLGSCKDTDPNAFGIVQLYDSTGGPIGGTWRLGCDVLAGGTPTYPTECDRWIQFSICLQEDQADSTHYHVLADINYPEGRFWTAHWRLGIIDTADLLGSYFGIGGDDIGDPQQWDNFQVRRCDKPCGRCWAGCGACVVGEPPTCLEVTFAGLQDPLHPSPSNPSPPSPSPPSGGECGRCECLDGTYDLSVIGSAYDFAFDDHCKWWLLSPSIIYGPNLFFRDYYCHVSLRAWLTSTITGIYALRFQVSSSPTDYLLFEKEYESASGPTECLDFDAPQTLALIERSGDLCPSGDPTVTIQKSTNVHCDREPEKPCGVCSHCTPDEFDLALFGFANDTCFDCGGLNGVYTLGRTIHVVKGSDLLTECQWFYRFGGDPAYCPGPCDACQLMLFFPSAPRLAGKIAASISWFVAPGVPAKHAYFSGDWTAHGDDCDTWEDIVLSFDVSLTTDTLPCDLSGAVITVTRTGL